MFHRELASDPGLGLPRAWLPRDPVLASSVPTRVVVHDSWPPLLVAGAECQWVCGRTRGFSSGTALCVRHPGGLGTAGGCIFFIVT